MINFKKLNKRQQLLLNEVISIINGFDFKTYHDVATTDIARAASFKKFLLESLIAKFPILKDKDITYIQKLISMDKKLREWYQFFNHEFYTRSQVPQIIIIEGLPPEVREVVSKELTRVNEARRTKGDTLKKIAENALIENEAADIKCKETIGVISAYTEVCLLTIEDVPLEKKYDVLKEKDDLERTKKVRAILKDYQLELLKLLKKNSGKWPDKMNPFPEEV